MDIELESMWGAMKGVHYQRMVEQVMGAIQNSEQLHADLEGALRILAEATRAEIALFWIYDKFRDGRIKPVATVGELEVTGASLKPGEGIQGQVIRTGKSFRLEDGQKDPRWAGRADPVTGLRIRTMLCVPLQFAGDTYGCLQLIDRMGTQPGFDESDLSFVEAVVPAANDLFLKEGVLDPYLDLFANPIPNFADLSFKQLITASSEYELERMLRKLDPFLKLQKPDQDRVLGLFRELYHYFRGTENRRGLGFGRS